MTRFAAVLAFACTFPLAAQWNRVRTTEELCREKPDLVYCRADLNLNLSTKPIELPKDLNLGGSRSGAKDRGARPAMVTASPAPVRAALRPSAEAIQLLPANKWRFAHPGAALLAGVNLKSLRESPHWRKMLAEWTAAAGASSVQSALESQDEVYLSVAPGRQPLLLLIGRVDDPEIRRMLPLGPAATGANAILMGAPTDVTLARQRLRLRTNRAEALVMEAKVLSASNHVWLTGAAAGLGAMARGSKVPPGVDRVALGLHIDARIGLDVRLQAASAEQAARILQAVEEGRQQAAASPQAQQFLEQLQDLRVEPAGNGVRIRLSIDPAAANPQALKNLASLVPGTAAPKPETRKVVIQGMEGGTREIPYGSPE